MLGNLGSADLRISHRPTQTGKERRLEGEKVRRLEEQMAEDKNSHRFAGKRQRSEDRCQRSEGQEQEIKDNPHSGGIRPSTIFRSYGAPHGGIFDRRGKQSAQR